MTPTMIDAGTLHLSSHTPMGKISHKMYFNNEFCIEVFLLSLSLFISFMLPFFSFFFDMVELFYWVLNIFTCVKLKRRPAITSSASYSMSSCPLAFSYCISVLIKSMLFCTEHQVTDQ